MATLMGWGEQLALRTTQVSRFRNDRGSCVGRHSGPAAAMYNMFVDRMRAAKPRNERNALETDRKIHLLG